MIIFFSYRVQVNFGVRYIFMPGTYVNILGWQWINIIYLLLLLQQYLRGTVVVPGAEGWWLAGSRRGTRCKSGWSRSRRTRLLNSNTGTCTRAGRCRVWGTSELGPRRCTRRTPVQRDRNRSHPRPARTELRRRSRPAKSRFIKIAFVCLMRSYILLVFLQNSIHIDLKLKEMWIIFHDLIIARETWSWFGRRWTLQLV